MERAQFCLFHSCQCFVRPVLFWSCWWFSFTHTPTLIVITQTWMRLFASLMRLIYCQNIAEYTAWHRTQPKRSNDWGDCFGENKSILFFALTRLLNAGMRKLSVLHPPCCTFDELHQAVMAKLLPHGVKKQKYKELPHALSKPQTEFNLACLHELNGRLVTKKQHCFWLWLLQCAKAHSQPHFQSFWSSATHWQCHLIGLKC